MRTARFNGHLYGGVCARVCVAGSVQGVYTPKTQRQALPLWTEGLTDRYKKITFPQHRLRSVINSLREVIFLHHTNYSCSYTAW